MVADEPPVYAVPREIHAAMRARIGIAALPAGNQARRAAAIQKQNALFTAGNVFAQFVQKCAAHFAAVSAAELLPHVHDTDGRKLPGVEAAFQGE